TQDTTSNTTTKSSISAPTSQTPPNSTLCSGTYYSQCSTGQDFVCPSNGGKAYCQPTPASSASQSQQEAKLQPFKDSFFQNIQNIETKCRSANTGLQVPTCEQAESQLLSILQQEAIIGLSKQDAVPQFDAIQSAYEMLQTEYYSVAQQPIPLGDIQGRQANIAAEMQILANDEAMFNL
ncbi:MAG: hypothetical protein KGI73_04425, partial [Patescibacteria group bacterium]|nr:hypothetical protein [Patescibacteria group bacterium]